MPSLLGLVQIYKQFSHIVNTSLSLLWRATEHVSDLNDLQVCASGKIRALFLVCVLKRTHTTSLKCKCEVVAYCINLPDSNKSSSCVMEVEAETLSELSTLSHQLIVLLSEQKVSLQLVVCLFWDHLNLSHEVTFFQWNRDLFVYAKPVWTNSDRWRRGASIWTGTQTSNLLDTSQPPQLPTLAQQVRTCLSVGTASYRGSGCCGDKVGS